ncbi:hypothetical protein ACP3TD_04520 [Pseudarthrobacter sp. 1G09]|uniref:hypothetical protein n=1 Tax=Pseudarthrobacter sp. 1G09 TaxID=3416178 RepID=UPI003CFA6B93
MFLIQFGDTFMTAEEEKLPQPPSATDWIHMFAVIGCPLSKYAVPEPLVACAPEAAPSASNDVSAIAAAPFRTFVTMFMLIPQFSCF